MMVHLSFLFYLNGHYMMAHDRVSYLEENMTQPEGSERLMARYAPKAFDKFIKPHPRLTEFIREHCCLDIA